MDINTLLSVTKSRLGITSTVRDELITIIIKGVIEELEDEKGINLVKDNYNHFMFVVDYSCNRYLNKENRYGMPRDLQYRLHNMMISSGGKKHDL